MLIVTKICSNCGSYPEECECPEGEPAQSCHFCSDYGSIPGFVDGAQVFVCPRHVVCLNDTNPRYNQENNVAARRQNAWAVRRLK